MIFDWIANTIPDSHAALAIMISLLYAFHFFADFMLQNDDEAKKKSSDNRALSIHVTKYSIPFIILLPWQLVIVNALAHWLTDYVSSRTAKAYWLAGDRHNFFVIIGADQWAHHAALLLSTYLWYFS